MGQDSPSSPPVTTTTALRGFLIVFNALGEGRNRGNDHNGDVEPPVSKVLRALQQSTPKLHSCFYIDLPSSHIARSKASSLVGFLCYTCVICNRCRVRPPHLLKGVPAIYAPKLNCFGHFLSVGCLMASCVLGEAFSNRTSFNRLKTDRRDKASDKVRPRTGSPRHGIYLGLSAANP